MGEFWKSLRPARLSPRTPAGPLVLSGSATNLTQVLSARHQPAQRPARLQPSPQLAPGPELCAQRVLRPVPMSYWISPTPLRITSGSVLVPQPPTSRRNLTLTKQSPCSLL